jgi:curved DNA-binding protein CbpA
MLKRIKLIHKQFIKFTKRTMLDFDPSKDYYKTLGITEKATEKEIKEAYHKLAKKYHPDLNKGQTSEKFKEMSAAYDLLSDKEKRKQYDELRGSQSDAFSQSFYDRTKNAQGNYYNRANQGFYKSTEDVFRKRANNEEYKSTYTFRDPYTGQWKTYSSNPKGNPFFDDINEFFKKMNKDINQQQNGTQGRKNYRYHNTNQQQQGNYDEFNKYGSQQGYDPYNHFGGSGNRGQDFNQQQQYGNPNSQQGFRNDRFYDYNFGPYEDMFRMYRNLLIMCSVSFLFFILLARRRENYPMPQYDPYIEYQPYPPEYIPIYNTPPRPINAPRYNDPYNDVSPPRVR